MSASGLYHEAEQIDQIRALVESTINAKRSFAIARIVDYNEDFFAVKVSILPQLSSALGDVSGWIPLFSPWVGVGWGMTAAPFIDKEVVGNNPLTLIIYLGDPYGAMVAFGTFFNNLVRAPVTVNGELNIQHKSGTLIHIANDSSIVVKHANGGSEIHLDADGNLLAKGKDTGDVFAELVRVGVDGGAFEKPLLGETFMKTFLGHRHTVNPDATTTIPLDSTLSLIIPEPNFTKNVKES